VQPKVYSFKQHNISLKNIDTHAVYIIEKLRQKGHIAYLVGGSVRDLLLKAVPKDFDISTSAEPQEIKKIFRNCILIGKRFRLAHIRFDKKIFEVSTFRTGNTSTSKLILRDNEWGTEEEDVLRRDFTINGLFYDTNTQDIIDYVDGFKDAKDKIIKTIGDPTIRFIQDPVRMIRLIKFKARFDFNIDLETLEALKKCKTEIIKSSQARILEELFKMLSSGYSETFFKLLQDLGFLNILLPTLDSYLRKNDQIYSLLKQIDIYSCKHSIENFERPVLISCLIFPILERNLMLKNKKVHLGLIAEEAKILINNTFLPFFNISRKTKAFITSILTNQFRFTPLYPRPRYRIRIPRDPIFNLSLNFLKIRSMDNNDLIQTYNLWHEHMISSNNRSYKIRKKQDLK
jgi:poly(A) polymerase